MGARRTAPTAAPEPRPVAKLMPGSASPEAPGDAAFAGWSRLVAGLVAVFAFAGDTLFAAVAIGFATWQGWVTGFGAAAATAAVLNLAACGWLLPRWDRWLAAKGADLERKLGRLRRSRLLRHPAGWLAHGSPVLFAIASALVGAVIGVAIARLASTQPLPRNRVVVACVSEAVFKAALYASIGIGIGEAVGAV